MTKAYVALACLVAAHGQSLEESWSGLATKRLRLVDQSASRAIILSPALEVPLEIQTHTRFQVPAVIAQLRQLEARAQVVSFENTIYVRMSATHRQTIAGFPEVAYVGVQKVLAPSQNQPSQSRTSSGSGSDFEASFRASVQGLHKKGVTGRGVRIGIIDQGVAGLEEVVRSSRAHPTVRTFPESSPVHQSGNHGTACVEVIGAMAPGAEIFVAAFDGNEGSWMDAAMWLVAQKVHIISYSGNSYTAPTDGSDKPSRYITSTAEAQQVLWVISSGNSANRHWSGLITDADRDGFADMSSNANPYLLIRPMENRLAVTVRWSGGPDPWRPSATQNLDAWLVEVNRPSRGQGAIVEKSENAQNGPPYRPVEQLVFARPDLAGKTFAIMIPIRSKSQPNIRLHLFVESEAQIYPRTRERSVLSPASARLAVAVGGFDSITESVPGYSAYGPTDDDRAKPDLLAPTNTRSRVFAERGGRFEGTSAAAPHAAGFAALLCQILGAESSQYLRRQLLVAVRSVRQSGTGSGVLDTMSLEAALLRSKSRDIRIRRIDDDSVIDLPEVLGGPVSMKQLQSRMAATQIHDEVAVVATTDRELYKLGETIELRVQTSKSAECAMFGRHERLAFTLLGGPWHVAAGEPMILQLRATEPAGSEEISMVCSTRAIVEWPNSASEPLPSSTAIARVFFEVLAEGQ